MQRLIVRLAVAMATSVLFTVTVVGGALWLITRPGDERGDASSQVSSGDTADDPGMAHIHALGVNPGDGLLYAATHTGLFRVERSGQSGRIGGRFQDTMGFTVIGPNHFLASGHPDARQDLPPHLGLLESTDAGATWDQVSLTGEADLHALVLAGERLYAADAASGTVLVSDDRGLTWQTQGAAELAVLVVDPRDPDRLFGAAYDGAAMSSRDAGRNWQEVEGPSLVAATWTGRGLVALSSDGSTHTSAQPDGPWQRVGSLPGSGAALAADSETLYAVTNDGRLFVSRDGGASWSPPDDTT